MAEKKSVFETLSKVDVSNHIDVIKMKKGPALKYVSWSWAWSMLQSIYPDTPTPKYTKFQEMVLQTKQEAYTTKSYGREITRYRTVVINSSLTDRQVPYLTTPTGTMVECTVTINGRDYTESLYVMDNANNAVINPTVQQINKTQKRCLVKALAMAGLGLNLYAGEDLPIDDVAEKDKQALVNKEKALAEEKKAKEKELKKARAEYSDLLNKVSEVVDRSVPETEKGIKGTALKRNRSFNNLDELRQKATLIDILEEVLNKHNVTDQEAFKEV
ncbi:DUF1071 domain-containing protein [Limosilactobacillus pontis]|uniref:Sak single strand annealing protein n=1 Tax=Limosilactobacillus pontis TaxID=35787 RepID=UPI0025A41331|nr:DUF1071 domain-containing protein [Limosilactobacillus pontis]MDM8331551.1 DUF1071 domain-containing protein [Limosilactobacillus pontis]